MLMKLKFLLSSTQYIPHGHCYLWQTPLVGLHVTSDAFIAIAYYLIPIFIIYFVRQIDELPFGNIFILFGAFILSCGTTHVVEIWTLWHPNYWVYGVLKAITALISLYTAFSLLPVIPVIINLPSPKQLEKLNRELNEKVVSESAATKQLALLNRELEQRVENKTAALTKSNLELTKSKKFIEKIANTTPNLIYIYDLITKRNIFCNAYISELLGYSAVAIREFKNNILSELIHPEDLEIIVEHHAQFLSLEDDEYLETEYRIRNIDNQWHWLQDKGTIFARNFKGQPTQIIGIARDITEKKKAEAKTKLLNQQLFEQVKILEVRDKSRLAISQINKQIQACGSLEEANGIIAELLQPLFPNTKGIIYLMSNSKNIVNAVAAWGDVQSDRQFNPKECWGIRLTNPYLVHSPATQLYCSHLDKTQVLTSLCLPMFAEGEVIGVINIQFNNPAEVDQSILDLAETVSQNMAMAFANLKLQQKLENQSFRDSLTGLYNRRYLEESLKQELERARRQQQFLSIMMLDVDYFKQFNDTYGHQAGDLVLNQVGTYLQGTIREYDLACRYGGEEIIIVMANMSIEDALVRAEKIRFDLKAIDLVHNNVRLKSISVSIGVSCFPNDGDDPQHLIQKADKALYQAKKEGRDCVRRYQS